MEKILLLLNLASTFWLTGVIRVVQLVGYPFLLISILKSLPNITTIIVSG